MTYDPVSGRMPSNATYVQAPPSSTGPPTSPRSPWTLKAAGIAWMIGGLVFALGPVLVVTLLNLQYTVVRRQVFNAANAAEAVDPTELLDMQRFLAEYERWEKVILDVFGTVLVPMIVLYVCFAALMLAVYLVIGWRTLRGDNWARIVGTVLCVVSTPLIFSVWFFFLGFEWVPLDALRANGTGLALLLLHAIGLILVWLPASNAYVRARRERALGRG